MVVAIIMEGCVWEEEVKGKFIKEFYLVDKKWPSNKCIGKGLPSNKCIDFCKVISGYQIVNFVVLDNFEHRNIKNTHTHTHTHIYIYIFLGTGLYPV